MKRNSIVFMIEIITVSLIISLFYFLSNSFKDFSSITPHPMYVIVAVLAMRNGNVVSVMIATLVSFIYISFYFLEYHTFVGFITDYNNAINISFTYLAAIIFGIGYERYMDKINSLSSDLEIKDDDLKDLKEEHLNIKKLYNDLKIQIVNSDNSILNLYEIAKKFSSFDKEELFTELLGVLSKFLKTEKVSIYTYQNDGFLRLKLKNSEHKVPYSIDTLKDSIFQQLLSEKKPLRKIDTSNKDFPIMSAPVILNDEIIAIVNVDDMEFSDANEYSFQIFKMIIDWLQDGLTKVNHLLDDDTDEFYYKTIIMKPDYFMERVKSEQSRKERYDLDYVLLSFKIPNFNSYELNEKLINTFRSVDVFSYDIETNMLQVLFPATLSKYKEKMKERAKTLFE
ncbi:hypothetical protein RJG79_05150 [Mycoplasmatota bacterium WC44]